VALLAAATVAGCSGRTTPADTAPAESAEPTPTQSVAGRFSTAQELGEAVREAALEAGSARGTVDSRSADGLLSGEVVYQFDDDVQLAGEVSVSEPVSADLGVVRTADDTYLRLPALAQVFIGSEWVRVSAEDTADLAVQIAALTDALGADIPGASLLLEDRRDATVTYLGEQRLDGAEVEQYAVEWDDGTVTTTEQYWIDSDDLLLRLESAQQGPAGDVAEARRTYADWGEPVVVAEPPAEDVGDLPDGFP
jgi:hypothetical protein